MEIAVVIDSCVFIEYFRSKNKENTLLSKLDQQQRRLYVSAVAKYEVLAGAHASTLGEWRRTFDGIFVLPFGDSTITTARDIFQQLKRESKLIPLGDVLIAATAIVNDLPLATLNRSHFERIQRLRLTRFFA